MATAGPGVKPIRIAILAMGGEGGGVLADWIVDLAEQNGYLAQTTSVPGVAQRTGATIYYVEVFPEAESRRQGQPPVFALMPAPGDVDIVLASELMEAGRAVQRGLVTPDRTTLIASLHRVYAIAEKAAMGDGRADSAALVAAGAAAARRFVCFDMAEVAARTGSVISAVLFGALSGTGCLPFTRGQFEATVGRGGIGGRSSLAAFAAGWELGGAGGQGAGAAVDRTDGPGGSMAVGAAGVAPAGPLGDRSGAEAGTAGSSPFARLRQRVEREFPPAARTLLTEGVRRLLDYQDKAYAELYLDRIARFLRHETYGAEVPLTRALARHLALWMSYEDTIRVADLKTRHARFDRVTREVRRTAAQTMTIDEFMHPRLQEICDTMPARLGTWLLASGWPRRAVERMTARGRTVRTTSVSGFAMLHLLAGLRRFRRASLRYARENTRIEGWLDTIDAIAPRDPALAVEIAQCQSLVKGYGDTHERGTGNFLLLMGLVARLPPQDAAGLLRTLREAALADEEGRKLKALIAEHALG